MIELAANVAGFLGTACIVFAYWYQTTRGVDANPFVQHGVNLAGALLLTCSLLVFMNLASFVLEFFWAAIAIWGLWKAVKSPSRKREGSGVGREPLLSETQAHPRPLPQAGGEK